MFIGTRPFFQGKGSPNSYSLASLDLLGAIYRRATCRRWGPETDLHAVGLGAGTPGLVTTHRGQDDPGLVQALGRSGALVHQRAAAVDHRGRAGVADRVGGVVAARGLAQARLFAVQMVRLVRRSDGTVHEVLLK